MALGEKSIRRVWAVAQSPRSLSPAEPVADPAHGEGGDHATDGEHGHGQGPVHGEDVWGGSGVLAGVSQGWECALCAILSGGIGGVSVQGDNAQHPPIVRFYYLGQTKKKNVISSDL